MSDLISRQAALNAIEKTIKANSSIHYEMRYWEDGMNCAKNILEDLPSAQPTVDAVQVVRCKDCRHRDPEDHKCDNGEDERQGCPFKVADDYFCAYGER